MGEISRGWQPHFADKEDFPLANIADKAGFSHVPTSASTNCVLQIFQQAKYIL